MQMKILVAALVVAVAFVGLLVVVQADSNNGPYRDDRGFTDREVVVFSDDGFANDVKAILVGSTGNVTLSASDVPSGNDIVLVDESWNGKPTVEQVKEILKANMPVIFANSTSYMHDYESNVGLEVSSTTCGCLVYVAYCGDDGFTHLYVFNGNDLSESLRNAYYWAGEISLPTVAA